MRDVLLPILFLILGTLFMGCSGTQTQKTDTAIVDELKKLAPVELNCDISHLTESDIKTLCKIVEAGELIDQLFLLQVSPENPFIRSEIAENPDNKAYLDMFDVMFGPWNRLDENKPFWGTNAKPAGAGFYPKDMTKEEFENAIKTTPENEKAFTSEFTVIDRKDGQLVAVPYHEKYNELVSQISLHLKEAAELTKDASLKKFLELRSEAFLTDDYFASDMAWMDLNGDLEIVIGPYEVYEDGIFNYKAAYEAFICIVDHEESKKLDTASNYLTEMESNLPIPDKYKNFNRGASSPIKVVQEVFAAGDTKAGIQTTAFNLPNDERVREAKGSKKVMLKNIAQAKYEQCWIPIVNTILADEPLKLVSFDAYFTHVLMHEMSHGLGPGIITLADGTKTTVAKELKDLYSTIEECKADVLGIYNMQFLIDNGAFSKDMEKSMYASYLGGMFRSIRFGIDEAHGGGVAVQFNYYMENGAFFVDENGKLNLNEEKLKIAVTNLAAILLILEAEGNYQGAVELVNKYKIMSPEMQKFIDELVNVPVDIRPSFPVVTELKALNN